MNGAPDMSNVTPLADFRRERELKDAKDAFAATAPSPVTPANSDADILQVEPGLNSCLDENRVWYPQLPDGVCPGTNFGYTFLFEFGEVDFRAFSDNEDKGRAFYLGLEAAAAIFCHLRDKVVEGDQKEIRRALDLFVQGTMKLQEKPLR